MASKLINSQKKLLLFFLALIFLLSPILISCSVNRNDNVSGKLNDGTIESENSTTEIPACEHHFEDWKTVRETSCEKDGEQSRICTKCNYTETKTIFTSGHIFDTNNICEICKYELVFTKGLEYGNITINNENVYAVTGIGAANDTNIVIPAHHAGRTVRAIANSAFSGNDFITSIYIPDEVKYIGSYAFYYCISMESAYIGKSVTRIEENAFYNCNVLNKISLGNNINYLGKGAFENTAYYNNPANRANGVIYIGNHLIDAEQTIAGKYTVKSGTLLIAEKAFYECAQLTEIILPETLHHINNYAFYKCENLGNIDFPKNLSSIGDYAFYGCNNITELILDSHWGGSDQGRGVRSSHSKISIEDGAFGDTGITKAILDINLIDCLPKENIETLSVFYAWHKSSILTFSNFPNLKELEFSDLGNEGIDLSKDILHGCNNIKKLTILVYKKLGYGCFSGLSQLESLTIPTFIDMPLGAFFGNEEYTGSVKISQYFKYERQYSGEYYDYYFPKTLKDITVVLKKSLPILEDNNTLYKAVSEYAFSNLSLDNLTFTGGGSTEFRIYGTSLYDAKINKLTFGSNVPAFFIGGSWYYPEEINMINYLGTLEEWLDIKNNYTMHYYVKGFTISGQTLQGDIVIPDSVTAISGSAFYNCSEITSITIPATVTNIESCAFSGCKNLTNINYLGSKAEWQSISKDYIPKSIIIHCTDGNISESDS